MKYVVLKPMHKGSVHYQVNDRIELPEKGFLAGFLLSRGEIRPLTDEELQEDTTPKAKAKRTRKTKAQVKIEANGDTE